MRKGSMTLLAILFLTLISLLLGYQLILFQNEHKINNDLIHEYQQKINNQ